MISVIIPANNEAGYIMSCLTHVLQAKAPGPLQVIVVANGCTDTTVAEAEACKAEFAAQGWQLDVLDLAQGGKIGALNAGDAHAVYDLRIYVDADIAISPDLLVQLAQALDRPTPAYASGQPVVPPARSFISRRYARFWQQLPFIQSGVPGCGVFAVNAAGRARWGAFPDIISDDTFVRLHFARDEMHGVPATFDWPITEGFRNLVRVRRRQDQGVAELRALRPDLVGWQDTTAPDAAQKRRLLWADPLGFMIYGAVAVTVRLPVFRNRGAWDRGR